MKCHVCGAALEHQTTSLPFKRDENCIVIVRSLPVLQCSNCSEYILDDTVMEWVENVLTSVDPSAELEIISYAA
jgi:YgiT-type zinc finger domain-containing protein